MPPPIDDDLLTPLERPLGPHEPETVDRMGQMEMTAIRSAQFIRQIRAALACGDQPWTRRQHDQFDETIRIHLRRLHQALDRLPVGKT